MKDKVRAAAKGELVRRRQKGAARTPMPFQSFVSQVNPRYEWYDHCKKLASVLERVASGDLKRLMVFMPPRHGKSELISRLFAAYYLYKHPDHFVGVNSYAAELAYTLSRSARDNFKQSGGQTRSDADAVKHWETSVGGGLWAAGVGGAITGKGFQLGIIDDPLKNAEEAASEVVRAKQKEWYGSTFYTRAEPDAAIIVIQTRWHEDDLSGWLLEQEREESPEGWHVVDFPAIRERDALKLPASCTVEPDRRSVGAALCPERYSAERLDKIRTRIGDYFWQALYQQHPTAREGNLFKVGNLQIVDAAPVEARRLRFWDKAATSGGGDYTAGVRVAVTADGLVYVEDVVRGQWDTSERDKVIRQTAELDGRSVQVAGEQEPGASGLDAARAFVRLLAGYSVRALPSTGSKEVRADPLSSQVNAGNVRMVRGAWNKTFIEELRTFPQGKHDDQVDAASGAYNLLAGRHKPGMV